MGEVPRHPGLARETPGQVPISASLGGFLQAASGQEDRGPGRRPPGGCPASPGVRGRPPARPRRAWSVTQIAKTEGGELGHFLR